MGSGVMVPKCTSVMGHKFEARYSYGEPLLKITKLDSLAWADEAVKLVNSSKSQTYECDICVRCGHVIERKT